MTEQQLDLKIDKAPEKKVRECLKEIASLWFVVQEGFSPRLATFNKEIDGDIIEAVTGALHTRGFCPPKGD